jgi:hypothetical protein
MNTPHMYLNKSKIFYVGHYFSKCQGKRPVMRKGPTILGAEGVQTGVQNVCEARNITTDSKSEVTPDPPPSAHHTNRT